MFKKLVNQIALAETFDEAFTPVDLAYQREQISWKDHQLLFKLCNKIFD